MTVCDGRPWFRFTFPDDRHEVGYLAYVGRRSSARSVRLHQYCVLSWLATLLVNVVSLARTHSRAGSRIRYSVLVGVQLIMVLKHAATARLLSRLMAQRQFAQCEACKASAALFEMTGSMVCCIMDHQSLGRLASLVPFTSVAVQAIYDLMGQLRLTTVSYLSLLRVICFLFARRRSETGSWPQLSSLIYRAAGESAILLVLCLLPPMVLLIHCEASCRFKYLQGIPKQWNCAGWFWQSCLLTLQKGQAMLRPSHKQGAVAPGYTGKSKRI